MKKILGLIIVAGLVFLGVSLMKKRKAEIEDAKYPQIPTLSISLVRGEKGTKEEKDKFLAFLSAKKEVKIATKMAGYIKKISVVESQKVLKGDLLVQIDKEELLTLIKTSNANLKQQKYDYALSNKIYKRNKKLFKAGALAKEKLDEFSIMLKAKNTKIISTKEKIKQLKIQMTYLDIKAPYDGIIGNIFLHKGNLVPLGKPILTLSQEKQKMTFSFVPKDNYINKGEKVFRDGLYIGEIKTLYTKAKNGLWVAEIELEKNLDLPDGSFASIEVLTREHKGCVIPSNTLLHKAQSTQVLIYKDLKFLAKDVNLLFEDEFIAVVENCLEDKIAQGSEAKLSKLEFYDKIKVRGESDE